MKDLLAVLVLLWGKKGCPRTYFRHLDKQVIQEHSEGLLKARTLRYVVWKPATGWTLTNSGIAFYKQFLGDFGGPDASKTIPIP